MLAALAQAGSVASSWARIMTILTPSASENTPPITPATNSPPPSPTSTAGTAPQSIQSEASAYW